MPSVTTIKETAFDDVVSVMSAYIPTDENPATHVIRGGDDEPESAPMVALNITTQADSIGLHGARVINVMQNPFDVEYGQERIASIDVTISDVDGDRADAIYDDIANMFTYEGLARDPQAFVGADGPPITNIDVRDMTPLDRSQRVGSALAIDIEYTRTYTHSDLTDPPVTASRVEQRFSEGDIVYVTDESGTDVYEET